MMFVKSDPTSIEKIARLIFGLSLPMNVISLILFGDYLDLVKHTWADTYHKVGMDMITDEGKQKIFEATDRIFVTRDILNNLLGDNGHPTDLEVSSDDIQGWEFQVRDWMMDSWYDTYITYLRRTYGANDGSIFQLDLIDTFRRIEKRTLLASSNGHLVKPEFYFMLSGKRNTHLGNSDMRQALQDTFSGLTRVRNTGITNGDDCIGLTHRGVDTGMEALGFKVTDSEYQEKDCVRFSSQYFVRYQDRICRFPESLAKSAFKILSDPRDDNMTLGLTLHVSEHPGREKFMAFRHFARKLDEAIVLE